MQKQDKSLHQVTQDSLIFLSANQAEVDALKAEAERKSQLSLGDRIREDYTPKTDTPDTSA